MFPSPTTAHLYENKDMLEDYIENNLKSRFMKLKLESLTSRKTLGTSQMAYSVSDVQGLEESRITGLK